MEDSVYKNIKTGKYYIQYNDDTSDINKADIFTKYKYLIPINGEYQYNRILYYEEIKNIRKEKLKILENIRKI